jgi:hypothetical protein
MQHEEASEWYVGFDWASEKHRVSLLDRAGHVVGERDVAHDGAALTDLCAWLIDKSRAEPARIAIAIETPHGPIVETLLERGFAGTPSTRSKWVAFAIASPWPAPRTTAGTLRCLAIRCAPTAAPFAAFAPTNPQSRRRFGRIAEGSIFL